MDRPLTRRTLLEATAAAGGAAMTLALTHDAVAGPLDRLRSAPPGWIVGKLTGAQAVVEALKAEGVECVFGIPGAQENELWDELKERGVPYLLSANEFGAACMADGAARVSGRVGVVCVVPGPGVTNALTGLGEALLDSTPIVAIVGDVANGDKSRPFQVHSLDTVGLLKPVTKAVYPVADVRQIPQTVREAFRVAAAGEPGPVAVVIPFNLLIDQAHFNCPPPADQGTPWDQAQFDRAIALLSDPNQRIGIYAGLGCMDHGAALTAVAELLQAPVATSVSGKGCIDESHPLAVGWGFGPHGTRVAESAFEGAPLQPLRSGVTTLLAIGVKFSEVSTGYYGNPVIRNTIHVDRNPNNLNRVVKTDVPFCADAGAFLASLLACGERLRRPCDTTLQSRIRQAKADQTRELNQTPRQACGVDPLALIAALRRQIPVDGVLLTDVTASEHWAAQFYGVARPRTFFNPVDNQSMGWSVPAAIGASRVARGRVVATLTGDGCLLMSIAELSTAAREGLPVKWFVLDDQAYHYMQILQDAAYKRTTATELARLDYRALAQGFGVSYQEIGPAQDLDSSVRSALIYPGPVLVRVVTEYPDRPIRWVESVRKRFAKDLSPAQKARFLARIGKRSVRPGVSD